VRLLGAPATQLRRPEAHLRWTPLALLQGAVSLLEQTPLRHLRSSRRRRAVRRLLRTRLVLLQGTAARLEGPRPALLLGAVSRLEQTAVRHLRSSRGAGRSVGSCGPAWCSCRAQPLAWRGPARCFCSGR